MTTKKKIRRTFEDTMPDVLDSVLCQCPADTDAGSAVIPPRRTSRAREIAATAAAFAAVIGMGCGLVLFLMFGRTPDQLNSPTTGITTAPTTPTTATTPSTGTTEPEPLLFNSCGRSYYSLMDGMTCVVRSLREFRYISNGASCEEDERFDEAFFEENSLIIINVGYGSGCHELFVTNITEPGENQYEIELEQYSELNTALVMSYETILVEINRVIEEDAEITIKARSYDNIPMDKWRVMFENDNGIDYSVPGDPVEYEITETGWTGEVFNNILLRDVEDLTELFGGTIPEDLSKYNDSFFAEHSLFVVNRPCYMDETFTGVSLMGDGNYVVRAEFISILDSMTEEEASQRKLYILELDEQVPEDVEVIFLNTGIKYYDFYTMQEK